MKYVLISIHSYYIKTSPEPKDKIQMRYMSIMRTDETVSELVSE